MEAVEATAIGDEMHPLGFERLPHRRVDLGMFMRLGVFDALLGEPGIELVITFESEPRREEALTHQADLIFNLALLPARGRRTRGRLNQIMRTHLREAAIEGALFADKHRINRGAHIVVDAALAGSFEESERAIMRVEHHLLGLARVRSNIHHARMAKPYVRDLERHRGAGQHHDLVAPVELKRFARRECQRHISRCGRSTTPLAPGPPIAAHSVVAAVIAERA